VAFGDVTTTITRNRLIKQNCKPSHNHKPAEGKQEAIALDAKKSSVGRIYAAGLNSAHFFLQLEPSVYAFSAS
jgi:hypothetical protein